MTPEALERNGLRPFFEMQDVRAIIEAEGTAKATALIKDLTGITIKFVDITTARVTTQAVVDYIIKHPDACNGAYVVEQAELRARTHMTNPKNQWMFAVDSDEESKENGGLSKQDRAFAIYRKEVLESATPLTRAELISKLSSELDMTKAGAQSYVHMCQKQLGIPEGGLVKSTRGRPRKS